jgi:hypothetical protein
MTIRLLTAYDKFPINAIITLDAGTEAGLVASKMAQTDTTGGVAYVAPVGPNQRYGAQVEVDSSGAVTGLAHPNGGRFQVYGAAAANNADGRADGTVYIQNGFGTGTAGIFVKVAGVYKPVSGAGASAIITGTYAVGQALTATYPAGVVGTIQFTRTLVTAPFTKTSISGAVASAVNSLAYTVTSADAGCNVGVDCSNQVSTVTGGLVPGAVATVKTTGVMRLFGTQNQQFESGVMSQTHNSAVIKMQAPSAAIGVRVMFHNKLSSFGAAGFKVAVASTELSAVDTAAHAYTPQVAGVALTGAAARSDQGFVKGTWNGATQSRRIYPGNGVLPSLGYNNQADTVISDVIPLVPVAAIDSASPGNYFIFRVDGVCVPNQDSFSQLEGGTGKMTNTLFNRWVQSNGTDCPLFCAGGMGTNVDAVDGTLVSIPGGIGNGWCPAVSVQWIYPAGIVPVTIGTPGDSISEGYEWPRIAIYRKSTAARPMHIENLGGSTTRTESFLGNMYLQSQVHAKQDFILLPIISVNNYSPLSNFNFAAAQVEYARLQEVAQFLTANGIKIIWWTPFNFGANPASGDMTSAWGFLYNSAKAYAAANGITFMDINGDSRLVRSIYDASTNPTGWIDRDGTHPSDPVGKLGFAAVFTDQLTALGF